MNADMRAALRLSSRALVPARRTSPLFALMRGGGGDREMRRCNEQATASDHVSYRRM